MPDLWVIREYNPLDPDALAGVLLALLLRQRTCPRAGEAAGTGDSHSLGPNPWATNLRGGPIPERPAELKAGHIAQVQVGSTALKRRNRRSPKTTTAAGS